MADTENFLLAEQSVGEPHAAAAAAAAATRDQGRRRALAKVTAALAAAAGLAVVTRPRRGSFAPAIPPDAVAQWEVTNFSGPLASKANTGCHNWDRITLRRLPNATRSECIQECATDPNCQSCNVNGHMPTGGVPGRCILFPAGCEEEESEGWELSYFARTGADGVAAGPATCSNWKEIRIENVTDLSPKQCRDACASDEFCYSYNFLAPDCRAEIQDLAPGACFLYFAGCEEEIGGSHCWQLGYADRNGTDHEKHGTQSVIAMVKSRAGLYHNKTGLGPEVARIVLVTASNSGYKDLLMNWQCAARALGLDWVVSANDWDIYRAVGPDRALPPLPSMGGINHRAYASYHDEAFRLLTCNKLERLQWVMQNTGLDVIFSDSDNVFLSDPFVPTSSFGGMIREGASELIYSPFSTPPGPREEDYHKIPEQGNTGFFFLAGSRFEKGVGALNQRAIDICSSHCDGVAVQEVASANSLQHCDDQDSFWIALRQQRRGGVQGAAQCFQHCESGDTCVGMPEEQVLRYCDFSPFEYPEGSYEDAGIDMRVLSIHANWVASREGKIDKLQALGAWHWNGQSCKDAPRIVRTSWGRSSLQPSSLE